MSEPLVTCLCLTRNRREWLPKAIASFERQAYPNRELLIVADGENIADIVWQHIDKGIRLVVNERALEVGAKRNWGCSNALGEIVVHFDDDDHSAPDRIADQVARLEATGSAVTGYHSMKFTDGTHWWQYRGHSVGFALGTSLAYRRDWWKDHPFPQMQIGEDSAFVSAAVREKQLVSAADLDLMYATVHEGNTSKRVITGGCWVALPDYQWKDAA